MTNDAAKLVSDSLLGTDFKTVMLGSEGYTIKPPTIKIICRGLAYWSKMNFNLDIQNKADAIAQIPRSYKEMLKGLCVFIIGDVKFWKYKTYRLSRKLEKCTPKEINEAIVIAINLIGSDDFFLCARSCSSVTKIVAKPK
ncbi:hypothetical protein [Dysgonomonas sp. ZJ279]|uniref:hypothetical protein n=1 Tax=Dysgonomonas sp. ZJ279 TaxID=2709796 RepID=UPI0013EDD5BE|nr:hypothetical protein [Dysgonomonas sp. ZJ279]